MKKLGLSKLKEQIQNSTCFVIYGAQVIAYGAYIAIKALYNVTPKYFIVSNAQGNPKDIDGISVCEIHNCKLSSRTLFIIAVTELLQFEIISTLNELGYQNLIPLKSDTEHMLMSEYYSSINKFPLLNENVKKQTIDLAVYECSSPNDKPLKHRPVLASWEHKFMAGITDSNGLNIANKNHMYSEMTAIYWIWKNTIHDWKGVAHYRRHLKLNQAQINEIAKNKVDVVLPLPYICYPNVISQFRRFVSNEIVELLSEALKILHPNKQDSLHKLLNGRYQYTYNLLIAQRSIYDTYCEWIFPILYQMELSSYAFPEIKSTRSLSYAAEVLTNIYFLHNASSLNIRHTETIFYT
jgi:hypothetical protein